MSVGLRTLDALLSDYKSHAMYETAMTLHNIWHRIIQVEGFFYFEAVLRCNSLYNCSKIYLIFNIVLINDTIWELKYAYYSHKSYENKKRNL